MNISSTIFYFVNERAIAPPLGFITKENFIQKAISNYTNISYLSVIRANISAKQKAQGTPGS